MFDTDEAPVGAPVWPQPGELWSLWKMLRAYAHHFWVFDRVMSQVHDLCPQSQQGAEGFERTNKESWFDWARKEAEWARAALKKLPVGPAVLKQFNRVQRELNSSEPSYPRAKESVGNLLSRFRDEMEDLQFLHVTPRLAEGLGEAPPFGDAVEQAFPSASLEIRDAARCLALGQGTAAVFHCMRALEPALLALGRRFGVEVQENWNAALNLIEAAVRDRENKNRFPDWKEDEPFYMEACTHFFIIKNAWRNHTMHLRLRFSEADALSVYDHTSAFMQHLATRLSEDVEGASAEQPAP